MSNYFERISRIRSSTISLFLSEVSIFHFLQIFIGPFDIEVKLSSRDRLFILETWILSNFVSATLDKERLFIPSHLKWFEKYRENSIFRIFIRFDIFVYFSVWNCLRMTQKVSIEIKINYFLLYFDIKIGKTTKSVP